MRKFALCCLLLLCTAYGEHGGAMAVSGGPLQQASQQILHHNHVGGRQVCRAGCW